MPEPRVEISRRRARQMAVMGQRLDAPRPRSIDEVLGALGEIQMDPTSVVARTEHLVLFGRLGPSFRVSQLERRMWIDRAMFEYWAHIVPMSDLPLHRVSMKRYPHGHWKRHQYVRDWLVANDAFVRYALRELRRRGPMRTRDFENRAAEGWETGGWNDEGQNAAMLLDILWSQGKVMIVGRDGQQRLWDLASRWLPRVPARSERAMAADLVERQVRARGITRLDRLGYLFDGALPGRDEAVERLLRTGVIVPLRVESYPGRWYSHRDLLDKAFRGRTVALSPFDDLISDRTRTERLFGMYYRIEIYVPKATRWGYFVLPVLHDDALVGRIDPVWDRTERVLTVKAWQMQPDTDAGDRNAVREAIDELGRWLRAERVEVPRTKP
ncbi:MAG TPA: crosslink repair DNA glycosylase YcaQ family protein [Actinomycetota bacterium]|nr:crosslink repair DNA glycosylase YcaQ family protein [Actinomycetota bacterium]